MKPMPRSSTTTLSTRRPVERFSSACASMLQPDRKQKEITVPQASIIPTIPFRKPSSRSWPGRRRISSVIAPHIAMQPTRAPARAAINRMRTKRCLLIVDRKRATIESPKEKKRHNASAKRTAKRSTPRSRKEKTRKGAKAERYRRLCVKAESALPSRIWRGFRLEITRRSKVFSSHSAPIELKAAKGTSPRIAVARQM